MQVCLAPSALLVEPTGPGLPPLPSGGRPGEPASTGGGGASRRLPAEMASREAKNKIWQVRALRNLARWPAGRCARWRALRARLVACVRAGVVAKAQGFQTRCPGTPAARCVARRRASHAPAGAARGVAPPGRARRRRGCVPARRSPVALNEPARLVAGRALRRRGAPPPFFAPGQPLRACLGRSGRASAAPAPLRTSTPVRALTRPAQRSRPPPRPTRRARMRRI